LSKGRIRMPWFRIVCIKLGLDNRLTHEEVIVEGELKGWNFLKRIFRIKRLGSRIKEGLG